MKIAIDVKNLPNRGEFRKNDILLFDGKEFYITTYDDLFKPLNEKINSANDSYSNKEKILLKNYQNLVKDFNKFKSSVSSQIAEMASIIKELNK